MEFNEFLSKQHVLTHLIQQSRYRQEEEEKKNNELMHLHVRRMVNLLTSSVWSQNVVAQSRKEIYETSCLFDVNIDLCVVPTFDRNGDHFLL